MSDGPQLMAKHLLYLENNTTLLALLRIFMKKQKLEKKINIDQNMGRMKARSPLKEVLICPRVWSRYNFKQKMSMKIEWYKRYIRANI